MLGFAPIGASPIGVSSLSVGVVQEDTLPPSLGGVITIGTLTSSTIPISWQAGYDNVGVASYEVSNNGGTSWIDVGNVLAHTFMGLAEGTIYALRVRAVDGKNLKSAPLSNSATTLASVQDDSVAPVIPGTLSITGITTSGGTISWQAGSDNIGVAGYEISVDTGTPSYIDIGSTLSRVVAGLEPSTLHTVRVRAYDAAGNKSTPLTAQFTTATPIDSAEPIWPQGSGIAISSISSTGFVATWPAATDNIGVVSYEVSFDTGVANYVNVGSALTRAASALASGTIHTVRVRAVDAAGNKSNPLTVTATTSGAAPVGTPSEIVLKSSDSPTVKQLSTLSSAPVQITYKTGTNQELILFNNGASSVTVVLKGSTAGAVTTKGLAGVTVDLSGGLPIVVAAKQFVTLKLDNAVLYLKGAVTLTASANGVVSAGVLQ